MAFYKIRSGRVNGVRSSSGYIGEQGHLFYDDITGSLRISDGHTLGGQPLAINANIVTTESIVPETDNLYGIGTPELRWNHVHIGTGGIYFGNNQTTLAQTVPYLPGALTGSLLPAADNGVNLGATDKRFANIYLGTQGLFLADQTTDANVNITVNSGTLYVAGAENLRLGNLAIRDTTLTSANTTLDISIGAKDDTGFFYVNRKAQFDNTSFGSTEAMVSFNASGGLDPLTLFPDTVLQTVGRPDKNSRIIQRSYGSLGNVGGDNSYSVFGSYVARGTVAAPSALKANDILMRISANGYGNTTWGAGGARVEFVALENFTNSAKGTKINFWTIPVGQITSQNVASIDSTGVVSAGIKFTGDNTTQTTAGIPLSAKAITSATYVATLGIDGKLDASQIPSSLSGAVVFKGTWNATSNTPTLSSNQVGAVAGWEYIVDVGGTRDIGDGSKTFVSGDFVIYDGTYWKQVASGNLFTSLTSGGHITVNQSTGVMVLGSDATPNSTTATIVSRDSSGNFAANVITANLTGVVTGSVSGNAGSVTNGVYTTGGQTIDGTKTFTSTIQGTITSATLAASVVGGIGVATLAGSSGTSVSGSTGAVTVWFNTSTLVTTAVTAGTVTTAAQPAITSVGTLTNVNIATGGTITTPRIVINDGGLRTISGGTTCTIDFAVDSIILWTAPTGTAVITLTNYTAGARVTLIIALTTTRDITYGISSAALSSTGLDNWNGVGGGNIDIANTAVHLDYTCISGVAGGCYVAVTAK